MTISFLKMINVIDRNIKLQKKKFFVWFSRTVFNNLSDNNKINFRKLEVNSKKLTCTELHLKFKLIFIYTHTHYIYSCYFEQVSLDIQKLAHLKLFDEIYVL